MALVVVLGIIGWMLSSKQEPTKHPKAEKPPVTTPGPSVKATKTTSDIPTEQKPPAPTASEQSSAPAATEPDIKKQAPQLARLYVDTVPEEATVKIMNIAPKFYQGIALAPGRYTLLVSSKGYKTKDLWVSVEAGQDERVEVRLDPFNVAATAPSKRITNPLGMNFVFITPGTFTMGSPSEDPKLDDDERQHRVTLTRGYYLQTTEVTVGQWRKFVRASGYKSEAETKGDNRTWNNPGYDQDDRSPVTCVSWNDAQAFIKWLSREEGQTYRLPTEAEWEYACRAGTDTPFSFGRCLSTDQANYNGNYPLDGCRKGQYRRKPVAVGSFAVNAWGLHDMHGNVWEWCQDWYGDYPTGAVTDPVGPSSGAGRVGRGGSWFDRARNCRSANRRHSSPGNRFNILGFRLARTP